MVTTSRGQRYRDQRDIKRALTALTACALLCALALTPLVRPGLAEAPGSLAANGIVPLSGGGYLSVVPVSSSIDLGETVDVEIWINDVEEFYGLDFCLSFNEDLVSVPSNNGTLLYEVFDPAPMHTFLLFNNVGTAATAMCGCTPETGKRYYHLAITNVNPAVPFTGSGRVVRLTFRGEAPGTTPLHFCFIESSGSDGLPLTPPTTGVDGSITVKGPPTLSIEPADDTVYLHNTVSVDVWLHDVKDIYGLDFCIGFDGDLLSVPAGAGTLRWEVFDQWYSMPFINYAGDPGVAGCDCSGYSQAYHYVVYQINPAVPFSGSGRVATLTFEGETLGTTPLHFCSVLGSTIDGGVIPLVLQDGSITVEGDPTAVVLHGEEAVARAGQVEVRWSTVAEDEIVGFNLYRAALPGGDTKQLNPSIIPVQSFGSPMGADYRYLDMNVTCGVTYDYTIEVIGLTGTEYASEPLRVPVDYYAVVPYLRR